MDRGAWRATVHRITRVGHDLATKQCSLTRDGIRKKAFCVREHAKGRREFSSIQPGALQPLATPFLVASDTESGPYLLLFSWSIRLDIFVQSGQGRHSSETLSLHGGSERSGTGPGVRGGPTFPSPTL